MQGQNEIEVNDDALAREADAVLAGAVVEDIPASVEAGMPAGPAAEVAPPVSWAPLVNGFGPMVRIVAIPQWNITDEEGAEFAESLTQCLDLLFPGGLEGRYAPFARLAAASIGIVGTRYVINGGKLPPLGPKRVSVDDKDADAGTGGDAGARVAVAEAA